MDLSTSYLGLSLPHPFMAGASPFADLMDSAKRVEDGGAAAIVMRSLFEEQLRSESLATHHATASHAESFGEATSFFPDHDAFVIGPDAYLENIRRLKEHLSIPVIASLNGCTSGGWLEHAALMAEAGADALELNLYYLSVDLDESAQAIETRAIEMVREVRQAVKIPLAVKLSAFYTSMGYFARQMVEAGADGLVLFNRFFEPEIDIEELNVKPHMIPSSAAELRLRLRWLAILSQRIDASLAVTGGVLSLHEAIKSIMCGADAVQLVTILFREGPQTCDAFQRGLSAWMSENEYESLDQLRGCMNLKRCPDPSAYERANYVKMIQTWDGDIT